MDEHIAFKIIVHFVLKKKEKECKNACHTKRKKKKKLLMLLIMGSSINTRASKFNFLAQCADAGIFILFVENIFLCVILISSLKKHAFLASTERRA